MPTPHISAKKGEIAKTVLMPGDPMRAKFIAENYLTDAKCVNQVRGMLAYTGLYNDKPVTIMGSGMGIPSIGIYSYELFNFYEVENIIRVGSAISYKEDLGLFGIVIGDSAHSTSSFAKIQGENQEDVIFPSDFLVNCLKESAKQLETNYCYGRISSSDVFYGVKPALEMIAGTGSVCGEMESFGLYQNAKVLGKRAATILSISDTAFSTEELTTEEREQGFDKMIRIALNSLSFID